MRILRAAMVGLIAAVLIAVPAAAAPLVPSLTLKIEPRYYSDQGNFSAIAVLAGATSNVSGVLYFRRYASPTCSGGFENLGGIGVSGNREYNSPNLQYGALGDFGMTVFFDSSNTTANTDQTSACVKYLRQQRTTVEIQLPRNRFDTPAKLEPQITASHEGVVELERFAAADCTGTPRVVPAGPVTDDALGNHSLRAAYRGTETLAEAFSTCRAYTVGTYVRGRVFEDIDSNGTLDDGEKGLAGVTVTLRKGPSTVDTAQTDAEGRYEFFVTSAGDYTIVQNQPQGFDSTTPDELALQVPGNVLADFGEASAEPSVRPITTSAAASQQPLAAEGGRTGLELVRYGAIALIAIAVIVLLVLLYAARARRDY